VARFDGDPADVDARLERLRSALDAGTFATELAAAKLLMLVDRESGNAGSRSAVEFYEVPLHRL
jgi:hypothetical protein